MKHPSVRELFDYWNHRRGHRAAADRADIDPGEIRGILADTFIVTFDEAAGHPFRIAGTRVCALFDQNLKHEPFLDLWAGDSRHLMRDLIGVIGHEAVGLMAGVSGRLRDGTSLDLELLALPLVHGGRTDSRVLGAIAPAGTPTWIGDGVLGDLILGTFRYVGAGVPADPEPSQARHQGRLRRGLLVYDGGLTQAGASPSPRD
jgi:hypothetical protein